MFRLIITILLLLVSLLTVYRAFEYHIWLLAVVVTEYCWVFSAITLMVLLSGFWVSKYQLTGTVTGLIALILYLSPIARAYIISSSLENDLHSAFNINMGNTPASFSFFRMFKGTIKIPYKTINYVSYPDAKLNLDFYPAKSSGKRPCIVVIHGGAWASGDSHQLPELNSYLAEKGYHVASINYRMAPNWQAPAPTEDVANALKYLTTHADELQIDTGNIILLGRSAGAQIALLAAYTLHDKNIKGIIDFYGPADMVWGYSIPAPRLIMNSRRVMEQYLGGTYTQVPQKYAASSPLNFVSKDSPPTLILHGANDVLVAYEHSRRLNQKLQETGIKHYWLKLPWATHGFDYNLNGPGGQLSTYCVLQFIKACTEK